MPGSARVKPFEERLEAETQAQVEHVRAVPVQKMPVAGRRYVTPTGCSGVPRAASTADAALAGRARRAGGKSIELERRDMPEAEVGSFVAGIPPPLRIGTLELADGRSVKGFICEPYELDGARDIT